MIDVHLHLPVGAQKKDGPSAGVAMVRTRIFSLSDSGSSTRCNGQVCAIVSLLTDKVNASNASRLLR